MTTAGAPTVQEVDKAGKTDKDQIGLDKLAEFLSKPGGTPAGASSAAAAAAASPGAVIGSPPTSPRARLKSADKVFKLDMHTVGHDVDPAEFGHTVVNHKPRSARPEGEHTGATPPTNSHVIANPRHVKLPVSDAHGAGAPKPKAKMT